MAIELVYARQTDEIEVTAEVGGYAPLVSFTFKRDGFTAAGHLSPEDAFQFGTWLVEAAEAAKN